MSYLTGFSRCCRGRDAGAYHHPFFLRGRKSLAKSIVRTKIKGSGHKTMKLHELDPDFYSMPPLSEDGTEMSFDGSTHSSPSVSSMASAPFLEELRINNVSPISQSSHQDQDNSSLTSELSRQPSLSYSDGRGSSLDETNFINELAMGCSILCQLRRDSSV